MAPKLERFFSQEKGNGLRTTARIKAGELIYSAMPLACCVSGKRAKTACHHCFSRRESLLRCSQCKVARYCDTTCQRYAWSGHKRECKCLRSLLPRIPTDSVRLTARIIFTLLGQAQQSSEELYTLEEHESHLASMSEQKRQGLSQLASMLQLYLQQEVPNFEQEMTSALPPSCQEPLSLLAKVTCNCFTISDGELQEIGVGLYPRAKIRGQQNLDEDGLMLSGVEAAWRPLQDAIARLEKLQTELDWQAVLECCHSLLSQLGSAVPDENVFKLRVTDIALDACVQLAQWEQALQYGVRTLPVYRQYYPDPHPAHGIQLMRVGKLQHYLERIKDAVITLTQAYDIIKFTHGSDHPLTSDLLRKMEECHAEMNHA
ncbi:histone-lysine N-methyltransferase SMYD3 [Lampris incognitus]|uniref:histone-lysine N-methyltransferase SMYD3 n=1 Tax=Lampris incognitus TaxID=2546036 RepID=UPI0024B5DB00|nr:histone-lysine N-methyltransferase SMYD3 [Lampris incognitus]